MVTRGMLRLAAILGTISVLLVLAASATGARWLRGDEIAFVSYRAINPDIVLLDVDHGLTHNLTHDGSYNVAPTWSPDGQWLAFASDREGRRSIYVMDAVGDSVRRVTEAGGFYSLPRWSADGQRLIFTAYGENPPATYSVNLDGSNLRRIANVQDKRGGVTFDVSSELRDVSRARSPDGSRIAFLTYRDQSWGIYIGTNQNAHDVRLLVRVSIFTEAPVWSPDGKRVAYIGLSNGSSDLYVVSVDGESAPRRLTFSQVIDTSPVWRP